MDHSQSCASARHRHDRISLPSTAPRIFIIDDATAKREAFRQRLSEKATDLSIEGIAERGTALVRRPDLVMWPVGGDGAGLRGALLRLNDRFPRIPVVAVSETEDVRIALEALRQGCRGYVPASLDPGVAVAGLRLVLAGGTFVPACVLDFCSDAASSEAQTATHSDDLALTGRETEVLHRIKRGLQNKIIAYELGISQSTVKVHVRSIMRKTAATNRTQVAFLTRRMPPLRAPAREAAE